MTMHFDNGMLALAKPMRSVHWHEQRNQLFMGNLEELCARIEIFMILLCLSIFHHRFPREHGTPENQLFYADYERHTADIAAFHLDRLNIGVLNTMEQLCIVVLHCMCASKLNFTFSFFNTIVRLLGFRRAFPVTGRILNITSEIYEHSGKKLRETFFTSLQPYSKLCFYGTCLIYCDIHHPVCGVNGMLEVKTTIRLTCDINDKNWKCVCLCVCVYISKEILIDFTGIIYSIFPG